MLPDPSPFVFLREKMDQGLATALVTVTGVTGASVRNPGAHMAVAEDGSWIGSLSGGCIEAAIVTEALGAIAEGKPRQLLYGAGSPFIDIRLPCGGSVDILITPVKAARWPRTLLDQLKQRQPVQLRLPKDDGEVETGEGAAEFQAGWQGEAFVINHLPRLHLQIVGHGGSVLALARLAHSMPIDIRILSPDTAIINEASADGFDATLLKTPADLGCLAGDPWTATTFYFHDHDWEAQLLAEALSLPGFFVGAMGSMATHVKRLMLLKELGLKEESLARLKAPIGLFHSSRDPATLALSTLAQIVREFGKSS
jgi:xanthine dehydrogenase accessory factor